MRLNGTPEGGIAGGVVIGPDPLLELEEELPPPEELPPLELLELLELLEELPPPTTIVVLCLG
jgi:hypothetical protein